MKKKFNIFFSISLSLLLFFANLVPISAFIENKGAVMDDSYYSEDSLVYLNAPDPVREMMDMQNRITLSLSRKGQKYEYDYDTIKSIVYDFDFTEINKITNENLNAEVFLDMVIEGIESVTFPAFQTFAYTKGPMCGVNKTDSIWNSKREYRSKSKTTTHANILMSQGKTIQFNAQNMTATGFNAIVAGIAVWSPPIAGAIKLVKGGYGTIGWWMRGVSTSLTNSNKKSSCGTVLDINLVGWYSSWNQIDN